MESQISEMECIQVSSVEQLHDTLQKMIMMQQTHNKLASDFEMLTEISKENINNLERIKPLIRACIKELFSLVEADLFLINQFLPYEGYDDKDGLTKKFKKTFRHHAGSFKKHNLNQKYQSKSYRSLYRLKLKRDEIVHPKSFQAIDVKIIDLETVILVYQEYRTYIIQLMTKVSE